MSTTNWDVDSRWCAPAGTGFSCLGVLFDMLPFDQELNNVTVHPGDCHRFFDPDVAGLGVVCSFIASILLTSVASIAAAIIDHRLDGEYALRRRSDGKFMLPSANTHRDRLRMWRDVLEKLILGFADQQLVSGFALLVVAWVKLFPRHFPEGDDTRTAWQRLFYIPSAGFSLVVFLCCGSSSAHLACLLVLRKYLAEHKWTSRLRLTLVAVFAVLLTGSVMFASSMTLYLTIPFMLILLPILMKTTMSGTILQIARVFIIVTPILAMLWIFWICTLQVVPHRRKSIKRWLSPKVTRPLRGWLGVNLLWRILTWPLKDSWRSKLGRLIKFCFWTVILGNAPIVFALQTILACASVALSFAQRFASAPKFLSKAAPVCSLHMASANYETWSFGQLLPMILLLLPLLSAWETFIEQRVLLEKGTSSGHRPSGQTTIPADDSELNLLSPALSDTRSNNPAQPVYRGAYQRVPSDGSLTRSTNTGEAWVS